MADTAPWMLVSNGRLDDYRCLLTRVDPDQGHLSAAAAERLGVSDGDTLRLVTINPDDLGGD